MGKVVNFRSFHQQPLFIKEEWTQFSNFTIEHLLSHLTGAELKVYLVICRATLGFRCWETEISYSALGIITGLGHQAVFRAGQGLQQKGFVNKQTEKRTVWTIRDNWSHNENENCNLCRSHNENAFWLKWSHNENSSGLIMRTKLAFYPLDKRKERNIKKRKGKTLATPVSDSKNQKENNTVDKNPNLVEKPTAEQQALSYGAKVEENRRFLRIQKIWVLKLTRWEAEGGSREEFERQCPEPQRTAVFESLIQGSTFVPIRAGIEELEEFLKVGER
mgnify:FL=1